MHVSAAETARRMSSTLAAIAEAGLDGLVMFKPESHYWLTGYDTFGYCFFQALVLRGDGDLVLLTRSADLRQAQLTSTIQDIRVWVDRDDADPARDLAVLLREKGLAGKRLGIELDTHGLTFANGKRLEAALDGVVTVTDASRLVSRLRLVKSDEELAFVRRAGELGDKALEAAIAHSFAGADEGVILARMHDAIFEAGGDYPGNPFIIGSGPQALLCRYQSGRRRLDPQDQLTLEIAGVHRHYHAALMRTLVIGRPSAQHERLHEAAHEALLAAEAKLRPGHAMHEVYDAQADVLDRRGLREHRLNACGYSLGAVYAPSWMDWPMFYAGNPVVIGAGMVFFLHMILMDSTTGTAVTLGRTSIVTQQGPESLSRLSLELIVR